MKDEPIVRSRPLLSIALLAVVLAIGSTGARAEEAEQAVSQPRATMHEVFQALVNLLPITLDERGFRDPARHQEIQASLDRLAAGTRDLARHGRARDASFRALSRSLSNDAELASARFSSGRPDEARFHIYQLTEHCVDCHSRLPTARNFPMADKLLGQVALEQLGAEERARLYVATRDFDRALTTWEGLFADPQVKPFELEMGGELLDYLTVAVRVLGDTARPKRALAKLGARDDLPGYLRARLATWIRSLDEVAPYLAAKTSDDLLAKARELAARGKALTEYPTSREGVIFNLAASSLLNRYVDNASGMGRPQGDNPELAEAFYLMGLIEERTAYSYWLPRTEVYMEAAVRAAPRGALARRAFDRVEEYTLTDFGGPDRSTLPPETRARLEDLERLAGLGQSASPAGRP